MKKLIICFIMAVFVLSSCSKEEMNIVREDINEDIINDSISDIKDVAKDFENESKEFKKYEEYINEKGETVLNLSMNSHMDIVVSRDNPKKLAAYSELIVTGKIIGYDYTPYIGQMIMYTKPTVFIEKVIKGDKSLEGMELSFNIIGGNIPVKEYELYYTHETDLDLSMYDDDVILSRSLGGNSNVPVIGNEYVLFFEKFDDRYLEQNNIKLYSTYLITGHSEGIFEIDNEKIYLNNKTVFVDEKDIFLEKLQDEIWLNTIDKPDFVIDITYLPKNAVLNMQESSVDENRCFLSYYVDVQSEETNWYVYNITQRKITDNDYDESAFVWYDSEIDYGLIQYFNGVKIATMPSGSQKKRIYFLINDIEILISCINDPEDEELYKITENIILNGLSKKD